MNNYTNKEIFYIDSHNRTNANDSHSGFSYELDINPNVEYDRVVMLDCSIPKTNYSVNSSNNRFQVMESIGVETTRYIIVPIGNYNRASVKNMLKGLLNDNELGYVYDITDDNANISSKSRDLRARLRSIMTSYLDS